MSRNTRENTQRWRERRAKLYPYLVSLGYRITNRQVVLVTRSHDGEPVGIYIDETRYKLTKVEPLHIPEEFARKP